ncbi:MULTISPECIES: hypothetical protein [unclassified Bosea (in: a-proteobacteria)]|uniref:winged helix domain-containing protein n=1 Tax=unclassified Bosea (in: a-proteobacteria) TaxID=2653178 RepID=UPI000F754437|nr:MULTISPECIES: hypothetical protein [unclassified Bosea (in: a-proteobacteria)]AZO79609.1 hypothetical protein BLM15_19885 [Bosea sp. Tri-49]RXT16146.1 hypothetical protein B5U98_29515 [Bosea sp. Tri-39]RXT39838.1 hypothetical protein B5U99_06560 [Bosea sp. Tri-54]
MAKRAFPKLLARVAEGPTISVNGREALTLLTLVERGAKGVTGIEFPGGPAFRLGAYVFDLRGMGVGIETGSESHGIGTHARYRLTTAVQIVSVDYGTAKGEVA